MALFVSAAIVIIGTMFSGGASAAAASRKADVARARKALVVLSDFPSGWTTTPYSSSGGTPGLTQIATCLGVPKSVVNDNSPEADSPNFNDTAVDLQVQDSVDVFPNLKIATQQFDVFASGRSVRCFNDVFNSPAIKVPLSREIGKGAVIGTITVSALPKPVSGRESSAMVIRVPATYKGEALTVEIEIVTIMSKSKIEGAQLTFNYASFSPFPASLVAHLEELSVERLG